MKKTLLVFGTVSLSLFAFSQGNGNTNNNGNINNSNTPNWGVNNPLNSFIKPSESSGYICWNKVPNANYVVHYYVKDQSGTMVCIGTKTTDANYARLSKEVYAGQDSYYSISAYNTGNGSLIQTGDVQAYIVDGEHPDILCERDCNGSTYAYNLKIYEKSDGGTYMRLGPAIRDYDEVNDIVVPYYQAISASVYNQLLVSHPYRQSTGYFMGSNGYEPNYIYKHIQIDSDTPGGPFRDKQNNVVTDGWLVEKQMDQYAYMTGSSTTGHPNSDQCLDDVGINTGGSWTWFYNAYVDQSTWNQAPTSVEPFALEVPTQLVCDRTPPMGSGSGNDGGTLDPIFSNLFDDCWDMFAVDAMQDMFDCIQGDPPPCYPGDISPCPEDTPEPYITGFDIEPIDHSGTTVTGYFWDELSNGQVESLKDGLYRVRLYTNTSIVIPLVVEQRTASNIPDKEHVKLVLTPTVVDNNVVKFKVSTEKDMNVTIVVRDLNGNIYHSENTQLYKTHDETREVLVNAGSVPQNQLRVKVICEDGTSKEEIALKVN
ncbi:MAG: hypothetical protein JKY09_04470 [Crocinitomicaceae bacterium]|nr:hypothetical protein [Crocinitomicaceae bacterium]